MDIAMQLREKVGSLEAALLENHPMMPTLLREIHNVLKADAETVTILTDEEIGVIVNGLMRQTNTEILANATKKGTGKSLKKTTVEDLGL